MKIKKFNESVNETPTVDEFLSDNIDRTAFPNIDNELEDNTQLAETLRDLMINFAKLHVEKALYIASRSYGQGSLTPGKGKTIKDAILTAYPLDKIK